MWLLVTLALAAEPTPVTHEGATPAPACEGAQRCGAACISWGEPCLDGLTEVVTASVQADRERELQALLCVGAPVPSPRPILPETVSTMALVVAAASKPVFRTDSIADRRPLPKDRPLPLPPPVSAPAPCGPPTVADDRSR